MREKFHRPQPIAWFFFLICFGTTLALGTWQVERLQWKQGLIAAIATAKLSAPITNSALPSDESALKEKEFFPVKLTGTLDTRTEFALTPRYFRDQFGYFILSPFTLTNGRVVLVNRGWVPAKMKEADARNEKPITKHMTITGLIRVGNERNWVTPPNQPDKNLWFGRDVAEMAAHAKLARVIPAMVDLVGEQDITHVPVPSDGTIRLRNDHLSYILTWYGIALGILVIFAVYHRKK